MEFLYLDEVNSTNLYGKSNIDLLADETVIVANRQSAGRGRLSRAWLDLGEGNLFVSIAILFALRFVLSICQSYKVSYFSGKLSGL